MMRRMILCFGAVAVMAVPAVAQEGADQAAQMKAWMDAATPGPQHKMLADLAGTWDVTVTDFQNPAAPTQTKGKAVKTVLLDGRFIQEWMTGEMMGQAFNGMGITGYNNITGKYEVIWLDSMGTMIMTGKGDAKDKTITQTMEFVEPVGKTTMTAKGVTNIIDANKHTYTMYMLMGGQEIKAMEAEYVRKK